MLSHQQIIVLLVAVYSHNKIVQAHPSQFHANTYAPGPGVAHTLETFPSLADFASLQYPQLQIHDLGETQKFVPEKEIKVIRTIKISEPYPVKVPVKVPYPVPVVKEVPIEVTKVVKLPEPVHVDIVKSVQVHSAQSTEHSSTSGGGASSPSGTGEEHQQTHWEHDTSGAVHDDANKFTAADASSGGHYGQPDYASLIAQHAAQYQNYHSANDESYQGSQEEHQ